MSNKCITIKKIPLNKSRIENSTLPLRLYVFMTCFTRNISNFKDNYSLRNNFRAGCSRNRNGRLLHRPNLKEGKMKSCTLPATATGGRENIAYLFQQAVDILLYV